MRAVNLPLRTLKSYSDSDLGVTPAVTTVAGTPITNALSYVGFRQISGFISLDVPAGSVFRLSFFPQTYAGVASSIAAAYFDIGSASSGVNYCLFALGESLLNNGSWYIDAGVPSSGNFSSRIPLVGCETVTVQIARTTGAGTATVNLFNLSLKG